MNLLLINYSQSFHSAVLNSLKKLKAKIIVSEGVDNVLTEIQKYNINIAMINWSMGDFDIKDLCKEIRKFKHTKYIYILLVISRDREESIDGILEAGADDFVFKPFGKHELVSRISIADRMIRLEEEIIRNKKRILKIDKAIFKIVK